MPFQISEADLDKDWPDLFAAEWAAWTNPPQAMWQLMFPITSKSTDAEVIAISTGSARQLAGSKADPHDRWVKVVDSKSNQIVGAALWKFFDENPYRAPFPEFDAVWQPDGQLRELCNQMYTQLRDWRPRIVATAHAWLNIIFTHPAHRNQGVAGMLIEWGLKEADRRGMEAYVEGTCLGRRVYERYGFVVMHMVDSNFECSNPGPEWLRMVREMRENPAAIMWRPASGKYVDGITVVPWEGKPRIKSP